MNVRPLQKTGSERSDATRRRLIEAGIDLFSMNGYEGATTRDLAEAAGANLAAIPYHFGGKDGLYRAVAHAIIEALDGHMRGSLDAVQNEMDAGLTSASHAMALIEHLMADFSKVVLVTPETERWICFLMREQIDPTEAFNIIYESPIKRMREILARLLSKISGLDATHTRIKLTCIQLLGLVYVFRITRASTLREMNWNEIDDLAYNQIKNVLFENIRLILRGLHQQGV